LHGFLGLPSDWDILTEYYLPIKKWISVDLFRNYLPSTDLQTWGNAFNSLAQSSKSASKVLIGYSMGGRLALHALEQNPGLWNGAILISTHLGLQSIEEKERRIKSDQAWAKRFQTESWNTLIEAWNSQAIFQNSISLKRKEKDFNRNSLVNSLDNWSLGYQKDFKETMQNIPLPILWIAGSKDLPYAKQAQSLRFRHPLSKICIVPNAGHRVLWDQPQDCRQQIHQFLDLNHGKIQVNTTFS
jgi:2-succinyl-6-hydroxy-2,4-cyclohexadiene-1-carboxylate synthase